LLRSSIAFDGHPTDRACARKGARHLAIAPADKSLMQQRNSHWLRDLVSNIVAAIGALMRNSCFRPRAPASKRIFA